MWAAPALACVARIDGNQSEGQGYGELCIGQFAGKHDLKTSFGHPLLSPCKTCALFYGGIDAFFFVQPWRHKGLRCLSLVKTAAAI